MRRINGTLIAIPVADAHGFINHSRYFADGSDFNRNFSDLNKGSLGIRVLLTQSSANAVMALARVRLP